MAAGSSPSAYEGGFEAGKESMARLALELRDEPERLELVIVSLACGCGSVTDSRAATGATDSNSPVFTHSTAPTAPCCRATVTSASRSHAGSSVGGGGGKASEKSFDPLNVSKLLFSAEDEI